MIEVLISEAERARALTERVQRGGCPSVEEAQWLYELGVTRDPDASRPLKEAVRWVRGLVRFQADLERSLKDD